MNEQIEKLESDIRAYKLLLNDSDYQALKYAEGVLSEEDYLEIKLDRQRYRNKINELEAEIKRLMELENE